MSGLMFNTEAIRPFMWLMRPPWMRYFNSLSVYKTSVAPPMRATISRIFSRDQPAAAARAAASTCQPEGTDSVFVSTTVTLASGTIAAAARAESAVPLSPEEMWMDNISGSLCASWRYSAANSPTAGCEVSGSMPVSSSNW